MRKKKLSHELSETLIENSQDIKKIYRRNNQQTYIKKMILKNLIEKDLDSGSTMIALHNTLP